MAESELLLNISAVERDTGLSKDVLRMWERRYGFPDPMRDAHGERVYPISQVEKLQLMKRLIDRGHRPSKIISLGSEALKTLGARPSLVPPVRHEVEIFLDLIRGHQLPALRWHLAQALMTQGLQSFVHETIAPLNHAIGDAWLRGDLAVFEEHLYTEQVESLLRSAIATIQRQDRPPRVLLTTFVDEQHTLGLLMVEALLTLEGVCCISLGAEIPMAQIAEAAAAHKADIVALSFSAAFSEKRAAAGLAELRAMLPTKVLVWSGGAGAARLRAPLEGVEVLRGLDVVIDKVREWRHSNASLT